MLMAALFAFGKMTTHAFRATSEDIGKRPFVTRQHPITESIQVISAVFGDNIGKFNHGDRLAIR
jgi:hypothetical protein